MLSKLIKYEFRGTARYYLPIFALLLLFSIFGRAAGQSLADSAGMLPGPEVSRISTLSWIAHLGYGLTLSALWVMTLVVTVARFYKNLLGNEGYLMFTLPVGTGRNILAKLLPAVCWVLAASLLTAGSALLLSYTGGLGDFFSGIAAALRSLFQETGWQGILFSLEALLMILLGLAAIILLCYLAMSIGQLANEHKFLASVGAYFGLQFLLQVTIVLVASGLGHWLTVPPWVNGLLDWLTGNSLLSAHLFMLILLSALFIFCALMFLIIRRLLSKHLNLA